MNSRPAPTPPSFLWSRVSPAGLCPQPRPREETSQLPGPRTLGSVHVGRTAALLPEGSTEAVQSVLCGARLQECRAARLRPTFTLHRHRGCSWCGQPAGWVPAGHLPPPPPAPGWLPGDASNLRVPATYKWARPTDTHTHLCHVLTCCHRAGPRGAPHPMMRPVAEGWCTPTAAVRTRFCREENGRAPGVY